MSSTSEHATNRKQQQQAPEWIPCWLRKTRALSIAAFCIIFAVCLEVLNILVNGNNGLSIDPQYEMSVTATRYLPTFGAVCLGFMWKALVQDAKKITPWSTMSGKWVKTSESVGLDYITTTEPVMLFKAARRRHWAVFIGLLLGFASGVLVAVANSLTYVDLFATHLETAHLLKTTTFSYSGISTKTDGKLPIPYSHRGQKPYAAVTAERLPGGQSAPWSKDNYVFESFNSTTRVSKNTTIQATVQAVYPNFTCHSIDFTPLSSNNIAGRPILRGNVSNRPELDCFNDLFVDPGQYGESFSVKGWLNMTECAENQTDTRLLSMLAWDGGGNTWGKTLGVLCRPSFMTRDIVVRADSTTGDILEYNVTSSPEIQQNIRTSMDAIYIYLNNPLDSRTQFVYAEELDCFDDIPLGHASEAVRGFLQRYGVDPFNDIITNRISKSVISIFQADPEQYRMAVEQLSNSIMSQILNEFARKNSSQTIDGILRIAEPKLLIRQQYLRIFQALLCLLGFASILQMTVLRPRTSLVEDPGSLASMAVLLANCEDYVSDVFYCVAHSTENSIEDSQKQFMWRLRPAINQTAALMAAGKHSTKQQHSGSQQHDGFLPLPLRLWVKLAVSGTILAVMVIESILLLQSYTNDGLCKNTAIASNISAFIPTVVVLLLGYACSGIDSSVRTMTLYNALSTRLSGARSPLLFNLRDVPSIWMPFRALKNHFGSAVLASSFAILLVPPLKIITAGLYRVELVQLEGSVQTELDVSLMDNLIGALTTLKGEVAYWGVDNPSPNGIVQSAHQYAEWALNPGLNIPVRSGILDNLVFGNIRALSGFTGDEESLLGGEITTRVPAIAVDVKCDSATAALYGTYRNCSASGQPWIKFDFACSDETCNSTINGISPILPVRSIGSKSKSCSSPNPKSRFAGFTNVDSDFGYQVLLVDWGDAVGYVTNKTQMPFSLAEWTRNAGISPNMCIQDRGELGKCTHDSGEMANIQYVLLKPGMLNISLPQLRAVKCYSNLTRVTVDTTFTRTKGTGWNNTTIPSWSPTKYDITSLNSEAQYNRSKIPYWLAPQAKSMAWEIFSLSDTKPVFNDSLWPQKGSRDFFFELLASYGEYKLGNISSILDTDNFAQASTAMYTAYAVNLLTELRTYALNASADVRNNAQIIEAKVVYPSARITQDFATTIVSECLLLVMFLSISRVSFRFPSHAILPQNPGSIAARASLLAHSRLVELLRDGNIRSAKGAEYIWQEKAGLGWWPSRRSSLGESAHAVDEAVESDSGESASGHSEETDNDAGAVVNEAGNERTESGEIENEEIDNGDAEYDAGNGEGHESSEFRTRVADHNVETARGEQDGRVESAREAERLLDHTGEQPDTRPSDEEATLNGEDSVEHGLRWGIDIGEGMIKGSWRQPPASDSGV